jgi:hypothetical protein
MRPFLREPPPASAAAPESPSAAASDERDVLYTVYRGVAPAEAQDAIEPARGCLYVALGCARARSPLRPVPAPDDARGMGPDAGHTNSPAAGTPIPFPVCTRCGTGARSRTCKKRPRPTFPMS